MAYISKTIATNILIHFIFISYVLAQTTPLQPKKQLVNLALLVAILCYVAASTEVLSSMIKQIVTNAKFAIIVFSTLAMLTLFYETHEALVVCLKIAFCAAVAARLEKHPDKIKTTLVSAADITIVTILFLSLMVSLGVIPDEPASGSSKYTLGFRNPNTSMYFLFSSLAIYYITNKKLKIYFASLTIFCVAIYGAMSRTYLICTLLILLSSIFNKITSKMSFIRTILKIGLGFMLTFCCLIPLLSAVNPTSLKSSTLDGLDKLFSYRILLFTQGSLRTSNSILGHSFIQLDSLYNEVVSLTGPVAFLIFISAVNRRFSEIKEKTESAFRNFFMLFVITVAGIFETQILKLSPLSVLCLYFLAFPSRSGNLISTQRFPNHLQGKV